MYSRGVSEEVLGRALKEFASRDQVVIATKVVLSDGRRPERSRAVAQAPDACDRRVAAAARHRLRRSLPDSPLRLRTRRSRKRSKRCTTSSRRERRGTSARRACTRGSSRRCWRRRDAHGWTRFVSMQNHYNLVYREEEREMMPLCREEGIGVIPWSPLARGFLAGNRRRRGSRRDAAREDRRVRAQAVLRRLGFRDRRSRRRARGPPRREADADRARVAARQAGRDGADHRRVEAPASRRGDRGARDPPRRRRRSRSSRSSTSPTRFSAI